MLWYAAIRSRVLPLVLLSCLFFLPFHLKLHMPSYLLLQVLCRLSGLHKLSPQILVSCLKIVSGLGTFIHLSLGSCENTEHHLCLENGHVLQRLKQSLVLKNKWPELLVSLQDVEHFHKLFIVRSSPQQSSQNLLLLLWSVVSLRCSLVTLVVILAVVFLLPVFNVSFSSVCA